MTPAAILAFILSAPPLDLDALTPAAAQRMHGRAVTVTATVQTPPSYHGSAVIVGGKDSPGLERSLYLTGPAPDVGDRITVEGVLSVVQHRGRTVNGVRVQGWTEKRVTVPGAKV